MTAKNFSLALMAIMLSSCEFHCSVGDAANSSSTTKTTTDSTIKTTSTTKNSELSGAIIKNGIELEATDIKVSSAYLTNDKQEKIDSNTVNLGEKIICMVELDTGWVKVNGKSFIGASEKVTGNDKSDVLLHEEDFFKNIDNTGAPADLAKYVRLDAVITKKYPNVDNYNVEFRIWDKKGKGVIKGKYKFKVR